jgi:hypothetical protein
MNEVSEQDAAAEAANDLRAGSLEVRLARDESEVRQAQALRMSIAIICYCSIMSDQLINK